MINTLLRRGAPNGQIGRLVNPGRVPVHSEESLKDLASSMLADETRESDPSWDSTIPAGYTYFGQFVAHDMTRDQLAESATTAHMTGDAEQVQDPTLMLSSVYDVPDSPAMIRNHKFIMGYTRDARYDGSLPEDIRREALPVGDNIRGKPLIPDSRNDDNLPVAQTHVLFQKFHNKCVDKYCMSFDQAREQVVKHYQWIIVDDYLRRILSSDGYQKFVVDGEAQQWRKRVPTPIDFVPLEFMGAAFRFGHSMVRSGYHWREVGPDRPLKRMFTFTGAAQHQIPTHWIVDWADMLDLRDGPSNFARRIDTYVSSGLGDMSHSGGGSLPQRTLLRGNGNYTLASGQQVAKHFGFDPRDASSADPSREAVFNQYPKLRKQTPFWYYILQEAEAGGGNCLGPLAELIVSQVILDLISRSRFKIMDGDRRVTWRPEDGPIFTIGEFDPGKPSLQLKDIVEFVEN